MLIYFLIMIYGIGWGAFVLCAINDPYATRTWWHSLLMAALLAIWPVGLVIGAIVRAVRNRV